MSIPEELEPDGGSTRRSFLRRGTRMIVGGAAAVWPAGEISANPLQSSMPPSNGGKAPMDTARYAV